MRHIATHSTIEQRPGIYRACVNVRRRALDRTDTDSGILRGGWAVVSGGAEECLSILVQLKKGGWQRMVEQFEERDETNEVRKLILHASDYT